MATHPVRRALARWWACLGLLAVLAACRGGTPRAPGDGDDPEKVAAALRRHLRRHPEDAAARRDLALVEWLHLGAPPAARAQLRKSADAGDPVARLASLVAASARSDAARIEADARWILARAAAVGPDDPSDALLDAAAELAVRSWSAVHDERPGDDERFLKTFAALDLDRLPSPVRQALASQRAVVARRRGEDPAPWFVAQGCAQEFAVGPLEGHDGVLDLARPLAAFTAEPEAVLVRLSCVVRVWNPEPASGVRRLRTFITVADDGLELELGGQFAHRVYLDGRLVVGTDDPDRYPADRVRVRAEAKAGTHVLDVVTTIPGDKAWVLVRVTDRHGRPLRTAAKGEAAASPVTHTSIVHPKWPAADPALPAQWQAPLRGFVAVEDALADGDGDRAEIGLDTLLAAKRFAEGHWLRARAYRSDPSRSGNAIAIRERRSLEAALRDAPDLQAARVRLFDLQLARGEEDRVASALEDLPPSSLTGITGELLRARVHRAQGNEPLAEAAVLRAAKLHPNGCDVLMARRIVAQLHDDVAAEDTITEAMAPCPGSRELRARLHEKRGRHDQARALYEDELLRVPDDIEVLDGLARIASAQGRFADADAHRAAALALQPWRVVEHLARADVAAATGNISQMDAEIDRALERLPHESALRHTATAVGRRDDLPQWRLDGRKVLRDFQAAGTTYEGVAEVLVLDRSVVRVYADGGQRQIVHIIAQLLSKEAIDNYGEPAFPPSAELLTLHSIKPDGSTREPELVPGKEGASLRHLEIGDFVEYEFVVDKPPIVDLPGHVDVSSFRFQSFEIPYHRSELVVVHPTALDVRSDRRGNPPAEQLEKVDIDGQPHTVRTWRADRVARRGIEPGQRGTTEELPNLHVYTPLSLPQWQNALAGQLWPVARTNPELRRLVKRRVAKAKSERARLDALWKFVVEEIEEGADLSMPATATLAERRGNRLVLLAAMLRVAGIRTELWLLRDGFGTAPLEGGHPEPELYGAAALAVWLDGSKSPVLVAAPAKTTPIGYLPPGYRTATALRAPLWGVEAAGPFAVPAPSETLADVRTWDVTLRLGADGAGDVSGTIELRGGEAIVWRQALAEVDADRIDQVFEQSELAWLPGADLTSLKIEGERDVNVPLVLRFAAKTSGAGVRQGDRLALRAVPMSLSLAPRYAALPKRTTGLVMPYSPEARATLRYELRGARFADAPADRHTTSAFGRYDREVQSGGAGERKMVLEVRTSLHPGVVEPDRYPELHDFAREIQAAEQDLVRAR